MRSFVRTVTVVPDRMSKENLDHTQFTVFEYISVAFRYYFGKLAMFEEREKRRIAEEQKRKTQQIEEVKGALLDAIYSALVQEKNYEVVLSVNRAYKEQVDSVLELSDFSPFNIQILEEDKDILASFSSLPIMIRVTKKVLGGESYGV